MKNTIQIAKLQIVRFFCSPIPWLVLIVLFVQMGYLFADAVTSFESRQRQDIDYPLLTERIFTFTHGSRLGIFYVLSQNLFLYLPLLTMGLISSELSSGTIKLIYSSPVKTHQFVVGKYLSILLISLLFVASLWLFVIAGSFLIQEPDIGVILSATMGVLLLASSYSAIGLFISSISSNQIVVAVVTFAVFTILNYVENLFQAVPFLSEFAFWLSMPDRAASLISGLFKSQDLVYFALITGFFILITILRLQFRRLSSAFKTRVSVYCSLVMLCFGIGYLSSIPRFRIYYDFTAPDRQTLVRASQEIIKSMNEGPLTMHVFANILDANVYSALPSAQNRDKRMFEQYQRFKPDIEFEYIYFFDSVDYPAFFEKHKGKSLSDLGQMMATSNRMDIDNVLSPQEIEEIIDLSDEGNQYVRTVSYAGESTFLRMFNGIFHYPQELQITSTLKRLIDGPAVIGFSTGHGERSYSRNRDSDYTSVFNQKHKSPISLDNLGYELVELSLGDYESLKSIDILVIADPKTDFNSIELRNLSEFIEEGGNAFITIEPNHLGSLQDLLGKIGVYQMPGMLSQDHKGQYDKNFILAEYIPESKFFPNTFVDQSVLDFKFKLTIPSASALEFKKENDLGFQSIPLIMASSDFNQGNSITTNSQIVTIGLKRLIRGKEQRILVSGDADFISNQEINRRNLSNANDYGLVPMMFHWLSNGEYPVSIETPRGNDIRLNLAPEEGATVRSLKIIYMILIPALISIGGGVFLITRKRQ